MPQQDVDEAAAPCLLQNTSLSCCFLATACDCVLHTSTPSEVQANHDHLLRLHDCDPHLLAQLCTPQTWNCLPIDRCTGLSTKHNVQFTTMHAGSAGQLAEAVKGVRGCNTMLAPGFLVNMLLRKLATLASRGT